MKIRAYSPKTGNLVADDITGINFGNVRQGYHCIIPVVVRPILEEEVVTSLALYLQNNGGFNNSEYGYLTNPDFITGVRSYITGLTGAVISDHFVVTPDPTGVTGTGSVPIALDGLNGDYIWLDVQAGQYETGSTSTINYRFMFEYS